MEPDAGRKRDCRSYGRPVLQTDAGEIQEGIPLSEGSGFASAGERAACAGKGVQHVLQGKGHGTPETQEQKEFQSVIHDEQSKRNSSDRHRPRPDPSAEGRHGQSEAAPGAGGRMETEVRHGFDDEERLVLLRCPF